MKPAKTKLLACTALLVLLCLAFAVPVSAELPDEGGDVPSYSFGSVEQLAAKFKEIHSLPKTDLFLDRFFDNEIIYLPPDVPWLKGGFDKITVNPTFLEVGYMLDGKHFRFMFYHDSPSGEFSFNTLLKKENYLGTVEYGGTTVTRARYHDTGAVVYAWQQDGLHFRWWQAEPEGPAVSLAEIAAACRAVPYAVKDGTFAGKYTGWAKDAKNSCYYRNGTRQTGWQQIGGNRYFFNRYGVMRKGSAMTEWGNALSVYNFDGNGIWDGKAAVPAYGYKPETLGDFLLDLEYPVNQKYGFRLGRNMDFAEFAGIKTVKKILRDNADAKLLYGEKRSDGELVMSNDIYRGKDDIHIRLLNEQGHLAAPYISFSKDKAGNSYYYNSYYGFGAKLKGPGSYDKILKLINP
jgi:hypothetical protein